MAWTTPKTWQNNVLITEDDLNTHVRDNLDYLKSRVDNVTDSNLVNLGADVTTTSTVFVDVDASLEITITTTGGDVLLGWSASIETGGTSAYFDIAVDGTRQAGDDGYIKVDGTQSIGFVVLLTGLSAGSHTFKLQWRARTSNTLTMFMGAGTSQKDVHPQIWAREVFAA